MKRFFFTLTLLVMIPACKSAQIERSNIAISLDKADLALFVGETAALEASVTPADASVDVRWISSDDLIAGVDEGVVVAKSPGNVTITAKAGGREAHCDLVVMPVKPAPPGSVDLGMRITREDGSRYVLYWSTCNLGASVPEGNGDYYTWGDTETHYSDGHGLDDPCRDWREGKEAGYVYSTYKWFDGKNYTKYYTYRENDDAEFVDNLTELQRGENPGETVDDVARARLGGGWRLPTDLEWTLLRTECVWTWTTRSGMNGYEVKSRVNDNSIFIPAAGYRYSIGLPSVGKMGIYWSSSLAPHSPINAFVVFFRDDTVVKDLNYRYYGLSVRPVTE